MSLTVVEESMDRLDDHARVPIAFLVERVLDVALVDGGLSGVTLVEQTVDRPWVKDYDAIAGQGPMGWPTRFDVSSWGLLAVRDGATRVGGAVVAFDTPEVDLLERRPDLAVLWDLRVRPECRSSGIGQRLFRAVEGWARARGCRDLKVETQSTNVPACRFYARMGCTLRSIDRRAYPDQPNEVQLVWSKEL